MPQLGLYLLKIGFAVEIVTTHPALFSLFSEFANERELIDHLKMIRKISSQKNDRTGLDFFIQFAQAGGIVAPRIPSIKDLREEIDQQRPSVCSLTHRILFKGTFKPKSSFHFNVVTGYDSERVFVNDPDWEDEFGGEHAHTIHDYFYAVYANVYGFIDGASIMKIIPKK